MTETAFLDELGALVKRAHTAGCRPSVLAGHLLGVAIAVTEQDGMGFDDLLAVLHTAQTERATGSATGSA